MLSRRSVFVLVVLAATCGIELEAYVSQAAESNVVALPEPKRKGARSVEDALARRRSIREFADEPLTLAAVSQLVWAAQGVTGSRGRRTAPSAGALYPLELYIVAGNVTGLRPGVYRYEPRRHRLVLHAKDDLLSALADAALEQEWVAEAPAIVVLGAVYQRTVRKYRRRAPRYVHMEVGHAAQNVYLQAVALDLGTTMVGAFRDAPLARLLDLPEDVVPLGLMPVGKPR